MRRRLIQLVGWMVVAAFGVLPLQLARAIPPTQLASQMTTSEEELNAGRYGEAIQKLDDLIRSGELDSQALALAHLNRGIAWQKSGDVKKARKDYDAALSRSAELPAAARVKAHYNRGIAFVALGDTKKAVDDYDAAIRLDPSYASAYHNRANLARKAGEHAAAIRDYNAALLTMQGDGRKYTLLGRALSQHQLGNVEAARADLKQALVMDPNLVSAREALKVISPEPQMQMAKASDNDEIVTASLGPTAAASSRQQVIKIASSGGWETVAVRYSASDQPLQAAYSGMAGEALRNETAAPPVPPAVPVPASAAAAPVMASLPPATSSAASIASSAAPALASPAGTASYRVQLASLRTQEMAEEKWSELHAADEALRNRPYQIKRADLGERGIYYRLQVNGFESFADAKALCADLSSRNVDCLVVR